MNIKSIICVITSSFQEKLCFFIYIFDCHKVIVVDAPALETVQLFCSFINWIVYIINHMISLSLKCNTRHLKKIGANGVT
jgi:hypothetical protein